MQNSQKEQDKDGNYPLLHYKFQVTNFDTH